MIGGATGSVNTIQRGAGRRDDFEASGVRVQRVDEAVSGSRDDRAWDKQKRGATGAQPGVAERSGPMLVIAPVSAER